VALGPSISAVTRSLLASGLDYPASRVLSQGRVDYELRIRARLRDSGDRAQISGVRSRTASRPKWRGMNGYHTAAGAFQHIVPDTGPAGILLPLNARPLKDSAGLHVFRRRRIPQGGRCLVVGPGVQADRHFGRMVALMLIRGRLSGRVVTLRPGAGWPVDRIVSFLKECGGVNRMLVHQGDLEVTFCMRVPDYALTFASGLFPVESMMWCDGFYEGLRDVVGDGSLRLGLVGHRRLCSLTRMASGAGLVWKLCGGGRIRLMPPLKHSIEGVRCAVERVMLPGRASWPTSKGSVIHPSGLVYELDPGESFRNQRANNACKCIV